MKILVTGASGLLGRAVYSALKEDKRFETKGCAWSRCTKDLYKLDLLDKRAVSQLIKKFKPELLIHLAAERRPDICKEDPKRAEALNVETIETLVSSLEGTNCPILNLSTDYVFDGKNPPYDEEDTPAPLNFYGKMKREGEKRLLELAEAPIILRIPILYGDVEFLEESAITIIASKILESEDSYHDDKALRYPTHTKDIAKVICRMAHLLDEGVGLKGIYHFSSSVPYSKYTMALEIAALLSVDKRRIHRSDPNPNEAPRPQDAHLNCNRLEHLMNLSEKEFVQSMGEILLPFKNMTMENKEKVINASPSKSNRKK